MFLSSFIFPSFFPLLGPFNRNTPLLTTSRLIRGPDLRRNESPDHKSPHLRGKGAAEKREGRLSDGDELSEWGMWKRRGGEGGRLMAVSHSAAFVDQYQQPGSGSNQLPALSRAE